MLLSCFFTLFLASWTSLHMNVDYNKSKLSRYGCRICLVLLCIIFPDFVLLRAARQLFQAIWLRKEINKRLKLFMATLAQLKTPTGKATDMGNQDSEVDEIRLLEGGLLYYSVTQRTLKIRPKFWTLTQAFWVVQSGLAVTVGPTNQSIVITPHGVLRLVELQFLPYISEDEIASRSKSDVISKIIVVAQALWFLAQLIGRVASKLPILLVEIHTAANALMALIFYFCWLAKCYQPDTPLFLRDPKIERLVALWSMFENPKHGILDPEESAYRRRKKSIKPTAKLIELLTGRTDRCERESGSIGRDLEAAEDELLSMLGEGHAHSKYRFRSSDRSSNLSTKQRRARSRSSRYCDTPSLTIPPLPAEADFRLHQGGERNYRVPWLCSISAYGAVHLAAWHNSFPSVYEQWLWRASALALTCSMPLCLLPILVIALGGFVAGLVKSSKPAAQSSTRTRVRSCRRVEISALKGLRGLLFLVWGSFFLFVWGIMLPLAFGLSRLLLLFEAFYSLRSSPAAVYQTINWSSFLPHVGG